MSCFLKFSMKAMNMSSTLLFSSKCPVSRVLLFDTVLVLFLRVGNFVFENKYANLIKHIAHLNKSLQ